MEQGVATVDLSGEFLGAQYTEGLIEAAYETLFFTLRDSADVARLEIMVEGKPYEFDAAAPVFANEFR